MGEPIDLDRSVPFVDAVLAVSPDGRGLSRAVELLRRAQAGSGLWIVHEEGAQPGDGVFAPRGDEPVTRERLREVARSWEQFDRVFRREPETAQGHRLRKQLWPFLDETQMLLGGVDFAPDHLVLFDDGAVGSWSAASWGRVLAGWARARRWAGRDDWHQDQLTGSLEALVRDYPRWRDALLTVLHSLT